MSCYLSNINLDLTGGVYLDCGVFFPFFYKDEPDLDVYRWVNDVHSWVKRHGVYMTKALQPEVEAAYRTIPIRKKSRQSAKHIFSLILSRVHLVHTQGIPQTTYPHLSRADISLLRRPHQNRLLLTSDIALHNADANSVLLQWSPDTQALTARTEKILDHS